MWCKHIIIIFLVCFGTCHALWHFFCKAAFLQSIRCCFYDSLSLPYSFHTFLNGRHHKNLEKRGGLFVCKRSFFTILRILLCTCERVAVAICNITFFALKRNIKYWNVCKCCFLDGTVEEVLCVCVMHIHWKDLKNPCHCVTQQKVFRTLDPFLV